VLVQTLIPDCPRAKVLFSPDGKWLLTSTDQEYQFWEAGTWQPGRRIAREDAGLFGPLAFSPDGTILAVACSRYAIQLIEVATCRPLARLEPPALQHLAWLCFGPDGTQLVATSENHTIQLWDLRAIRARLATMNLDWPMPPYAPRAATKSLQALSVKVVLEEDSRP
jgi:WD40 repeat protein